LARLCTNYKTVELVGVTNHFNAEQVATADDAQVAIQPPQNNTSMHMHQNVDKLLFLESMVSTVPWFT